MNRYLQDIFDQPETLQTVLDYCLGPGRDELERAGRILSSARRVVVTSMGSAFYSSMPLHYALSRIHANVQLEETAELLVQAPFAEETVYVIMSRSGESGEIALFAEQIRQRGGKLVAVTMAPDSRLARLADCVLNTAAGFDGLICTKAFTGMVLVGLLLVSEMEGALNKGLTEGLEGHFAWMEGEKERLLEEICAVKALEQVHNVYFQSRGAGMAVARVGALLMEEAARVRAGVYSFGMFHHGPVELVDGDFAAFWIDLASDERSRELFGEAASKEGALITVSPEPGSYPGGVILPSAGLPEAYRTLSAAMVVQLAAYYVATTHGLEPGEMRYLNWLVK